MLLEYISLASGLNFTFLAVVLYRRNTQRLKPTAILIKLLLCMALYSSLVFLHYSAVDKGMVSILWYYLPVDGIFLALLPPCLYFYVMSVLQLPTKLTRWKLLLHSLPLIPYLVFNLYFVSLSRDARVEWLIRDFQTGTFENNLLNAVLYIQIVVYLLISYNLVKDNIRQRCNYPSDNAQQDVSWLKTYLLLNLIFTLVSAPVCFYFANERANIIIGQLAMDIQFVYMFFKWTNHTEVAPVQSMSEPEVKIAPEKALMNIPDTQLADLIRYMESYKPYLSEACSINTLSEQTGIPIYQLSNLLNCKLQKSFPEYINEYRINAAKELLLSFNAELNTIETIGFECGFGSKSAFHRAFKKYSNNLTPSEFLRQSKEFE